MARRERKCFIVTILRRTQVEEMFAHARSARPAECCGLIGGREGVALTMYRLRNVARDSLVAYEAAPEDLFAAQRLMRGRSEELLAIYHSHPRAAEPVPSETDVRLAFYPAAVYFIIGFAPGDAGVLRAFHLSEGTGNWEQIEYRVADD